MEPPVEIPLPATIEAMVEKAPVDAPMELTEQKPAVPAESKLEEVAKESTSSEAKDEVGEIAEAPSPKKGAKRRGKRKSGEMLDPESVREKKNLRSSASRSAAAAQARAEREQAAAKLEAERAAEQDNA